MENYMVYVNCKWLVSIESDTVLHAEHKILDLDGMQYAQAFDKEAMKTEHFRGCLLNAQTISFAELETMSGCYADAWKRAKAAMDEEDAAQMKLNEIRRMLEHQEDVLRAAKAAREKAVSTAGWYNAEVGVDTVE